MKRAIEIEHVIGIDEIIYSLYDEEQKEVLIEELLESVSDSKKMDILARHLDDICHSDMIAYLRNEGYTVTETD